MPAPGPRPELVVFDLGGVLVRIARSWAEACANAGVDLRGDADAASTWAAREPYIVAHETGRIGREAFNDPLSRIIYRPFFDRWAERLAQLRWVQQGKIHYYLLYFVVVLVLAFGWLVLRQLVPA